MAEREGFAFPLIDGIYARSSFDAVSTILTRLFADDLAGCALRKRIQTRH
jgi:hypothetical protein